MLVPLTCPLCGAVGAAPCADCISVLPSPPRVPPPPGLDQCVALWAHEAGARALVGALKYRNARRVIPAVAARLADAVADAVEPIGLVDAVVAVPASLAKRRQRGYDQGVLLARGVARRLGAPMHHALVRLDRHGQTGRGRTERLDGAHIATRRGTRVSGTVVVVDDVCTTGSSLSHAAEVLRAAGAWHVVGAVLTRRDREPDLLGGHWARSCRGPLA